MMRDRYGTVALLAIAACTAQSQENEERKPAVQRVATAESRDLDAGSYGDADSKKTVLVDPGWADPGSPLADRDLLDAPDDEYDQVPGRQRIHRSCVHQVPHGARIDAQKLRVFAEDGTPIAQFQHCRYKAHRASGSIVPVPDVDLYQEYSAADATRPVCGNSGYPLYFTQQCWPWFNSFYGSVNVPANPSSLGQTIFLWSGLVSKETIGDFLPLLQPVLQWGTSRAGGGTYWSFASWFIDHNRNVWHTPLVYINPGDWYVMNTYVSSGSTCEVTRGWNCNWTVRGSRWSDGAYASLFPMNVAGSFDTVYRAVLEAYGPGKDSTPNCSIYPVTGGTTFTNTQAFQPKSGPTDFWLNDQNWQAVTHNITPYCYGQTTGTQRETYFYFHN